MLKKRKINELQEEVIAKNFVISCQSDVINENEKEIIEKENYIRILEQSLELIINNLSTKKKNLLGINNKIGFIFDENFK